MTQVIDWPSLPKKFTKRMKLSQSTYDIIRELLAIEFEANIWASQVSKKQAAKHYNQCDIQNESLGSKHSFKVMNAYRDKQRKLRARQMKLERAIKELKRVQSYE